MQEKIKQLAQKAAEQLKVQFNLPKDGFLAGGSIANLIWEYYSGNKAVINDVDIFKFSGYEEKPESNREKKSLFQWEEKEQKFFEDYRGMRNWDSYTKNFYRIVESTKDSVINEITYKSNTDQPQIILNSFDINATRVGWCLKTDTPYWTPDFEDFLKTGELKLCNISTPSHTAVRIAKKKKELGAKLDPFEFEILQFALCRRFHDRVKFRFLERYHELYNQNIDILGEWFQISRDIETEMWVKNQHGKEVNLYFLYPKIEGQRPESYLPDHTMIPYFKDDDNLTSIYTSSDFLFYIRNIYRKSDTLKEIWPKFHFFIHEGYVDKKIDDDDIELLERFCKFAPASINNLKGMKLSEQIETIKKFLDVYKDDPLIAISILEKVKVDSKIELDEQTALILELSVRKEIINDTRGKVNRILNIKSEHPVDDTDFCF
jgi:hypothetical protein